MATSPQAFYCLWQEEGVREKLFGLLSKKDICAVRAASTACCNLVTKRLFTRTHLTFTASTFTKPSRVQALSRVGHHVEHLTFRFAHSEATFLPPLIHPLTGHEISYLYTPHTSMASVLARPKYGNSELGDILTQQYPPLFHAATNVPSFINAMQHLPNLRHLSIRTPGQSPSERYRRDIVDYALISLRIAVERAPMPRLSKLSLAVHPAAFNYLRHVQGFGCAPSAARRWRQIRTLHLAVDSWDFAGPSPGLDHLKVMDDYVRHLAPQLEKLTFAWQGRARGPCPLALAGDPLFAPPRGSRKLFNEVTSPMSPLPPIPGRGPIFFPRVRYLQVRNAAMTAPQLADLVGRHRGSAREFDFDNVVLLHGGSWDDALAPLMTGGGPGGAAEGEGGGHHRPHRGGEWSRSSIVAVGAGPRTPVAPEGDGRRLRGPSAAAAAASQELLDLDVGDPEAFVGLGSGLGSESGSGRDGAEEEEDDDDEDEDRDDGRDLVDDVDAGAGDRGALASEIAAAMEASEGFSTTVKRKRTRRRRRKPWHAKREDGPQPSPPPPPPSSSAASTPTPERAAGKPRGGEGGGISGFLRRARSHEDKAAKKERAALQQQLQQGPPGLQRSRSSPTRNRLQRHQHPPQQQQQQRHRFSYEEAPVPEVVGTDDELDDDLPALTTSSSAASFRRPATPPMAISAPLPADPLPVLLQPAVYDPTRSPPPPPPKNKNKAAAAPVPRVGGGGGRRDGPGGDEALLQLSGVQRNIEQEEAQRLLAEDAAARTSALRKAKEAVLLKLSREFCKWPQPAPGGGGAGGGGGGGGRRRQGPTTRGLFGALPMMGATATGPPPAPPDHRSVASGSSVVVPLMFSRG